MRVLVVVDSNMAPATVREALAYPGIEIDLVEGFASTGVAGSDHDALILACGGYSDELKDLVEQAVRVNPSRPVLIASWSAATAYLHGLLKLGATEILQMPEEAPRLPQALTSLMTKAAAAANSGLLIGVIGAKGGVGKTLTTANLAVALAMGGKRVAVVDGDMQFGDVGITLGLAPDRTIYDLARSGGRLTDEKISSFLMRHPSGVEALLAPLRPEQANLITDEFLQEVWRVLRQSHDYVLVDTCPGFPPEVISVIDASSHLCVVGALDASSLKDTRLGLETLERMGYDMSRVKLLLNRADPSLGISLEDATAVLGRAPDVTLPAERLITRSTNLGQPIVLSGRKTPDVVKAFLSLAALFPCPSRPPAAAQQPSPQPHAGSSPPVPVLARPREVIA